MPKTSAPTRPKKHEGVADAFKYEVLSGLIAEVAELRAEIGGLREQLATEVRTRRLIVVNPRGFESIVASAGDAFAEVMLTSEQDPSVWSSLHSNDEGEPSSGVYLSGGDNGLGIFEVEKTELDADVNEYSARLAIHADRNDPRFHDIGLDREGLHFGG